MKLLEHEAKKILRQFAVAVPESTLITSPSDTPIPPIVLKSQVPVGGRGKAGGVVLVENNTKIVETINKLFELEIKGFKPSTILAEEVLEIKQEYYLSLLIDRATASIFLLASKNGGIEVESQTDFEKWPVDGSKSSSDKVGLLLSEYFGLESHQFALQDLIEKIVACFVSNDATLLEINPLVLTTDGKLIAGDCKMELDDSAAFRHQDWDFEQKLVDANFVELDRTGNIATVANGAGLAMATVDAVANAGLKPANFLDIGGGANEESVLRAFERIVEYDNVQAIVINIFAGITRCDEIAKAVIAAKKHLSNLPPIFIRLAGTNFDIAKKLLENENIPLESSLENCITAAKKKVVS